MNIQQLRILRETVRCNFNLTEVAMALFTSQSGVSKAIKELEDELNLEIFERRGKRVVGFTEAGQSVADHAQRALQEIENLRSVGQSVALKDEGRLVLATTHTQARYSLPEIVRAFRERFPKVQLVLRQASPPEISDLLESGEADIGIATETLSSNRYFVTFPFFKWFHGVVVPKGHALGKLIAQGEALSLAAIAAHPIITYHQGFTGRAMINATFAQAGLAPQVVLEALDADVIKAYVSLGMGVGLIASVAYDEQSDAGLELLDASELFEENTTVLAMRRGRLLPGYVLHFAQLCLRGHSEAQLQSAVMEESES